MSVSSRLTRLAVPAAGIAAALALTACAAAPGPTAPPESAAVSVDSAPAYVPPAASAQVAVVTSAKLTSSSARGNLWSGKVRAYGDSVMLGAKPALQKRLHARVFAAVSRQSWTVLGKVLKAAKKGRVHGPVVIHTGTNGTVEKSLLLKVARRVPTIVVLVTAKAARSWVPGVNATLRAVDAKRADVVLFDWQKYSSGHGSWFYGDGIHLTSSGATAYANGIAKALHR